MVDINQKTRDRIAKAYARGDRVADICEAVGLSRGTLYGVLAECGIAKRTSRGENVTAQSTDEVTADAVRSANKHVPDEFRRAVIEECLREGTATTRDIADRRGVMLPTVHKWLLEHYRQTPTETRSPRFRRVGGQNVTEMLRLVEAARNREAPAAAAAEISQQQTLPQPPPQPPQQPAARALLPQPGERYTPRTEVDMLRETLREALEERAALRRMVDILNNEIATLKGNNKR